MYLLQVAFKCPCLKIKTSSFCSAMNKTHNLISNFLSWYKRGFSKYFWIKIYSHFISFPFFLSEKLIFFFSWIVSSFSIILSKFFSTVIYLPLFKLIGLIIHIFFPLLNVWGIFIFCVEPIFLLKITLNISENFLFPLGVNLSILWYNFLKFDNCSLKLQWDNWSDMVKGKILKASIFFSSQCFNKFA